MGVNLTPQPTLKQRGVEPIDMHISRMGDSDSLSPPPSLAVGFHPLRPSAPSALSAFKLPYACALDAGTSVDAYTRPRDNLAKRLMRLPLLTLLAVALSTANARCDPDQPVRILRPFHLPLLQDSGYVEIKSVPVHKTFEGNPFDDLSRTLCSPIFPSTDDPGDKRDLNILSLSKIRITFERHDGTDGLDGNSDVNMIIDLTEFTQPKQTNLNAHDIVQMLLLCLRMEAIPGVYPNIHIRFRGATEAMGLAALAGPLWATGHDKFPLFADPPNPASSLRTITEMSLPLIDRLGSASIYDVPVIKTLGSPADYAAALCSPFYAASENAAESHRDINLISLSKIKITMERLNDSPLHHPSSRSRVIIDLSHFVQPKESDIELYDIVQLIFTCLRSYAQVGVGGSIDIRITGAHDPGELQKLEGPLWKTDGQKMLDRDPWPPKSPK
jgi:hypothetical protein